MTISSSRPLRSLVAATFLAALLAAPGLAADPESAETERRPDLPRVEVETTEIPGDELTATVEAEVQGDEVPGDDILPLDQVYEGQKGYGLSVFAGREPVRFDVEVVGVWRNNTPELSYLITRLSGQDLERSGVLGGMSGSPVYLDDKLVGAVAFSFQFGLDPIAGVTPIAAMRRLSEAAGGLPIGPNAEDIVPARKNTATSATGPSAGRSAIAPPTLREIVRREVAPELLDRFLGVLAPSPGATAAGGLGEARPALTWTASGFAGEARSRLERVIGPVAAVPKGFGGLSAGLAAGASTDPAADPAAEDFTRELQPGDAVSLVLVRGDLSLAAHGTVTDRQGDSILAFGHPVFSLGPTRLPMGASEVILPIASVADSFKLSNAGPLVGVFDQDREAGAHGVLGERPSLVPFSLRMHGLEEREYRMELADSEIFKPTLIAMATMASLDAGSYAGGFQGLDLEARFVLDDREDLVLRQSFDGGRAAGDASIQLLAFAAFLELNEMERLPVRGLHVDLHQVERPHAAELTGVRADRRRVAPGQKVAITLELRPFRGEPYEERVEVEIPESLDEGAYYLMIGDGTSMDAARDAVAPREVETVDQALDQLRDLHPRSELHFLGLVGAPGVSVAGAVLPDLPGSVRGVYGRAGVGQPLNLRIVEEEIRTLDRPIEGIHRIDFEIRDFEIRDSEARDSLRPSR